MNLRVASGGPEEPGHQYEDEDFGSSARSHNDISGIVYGPAVQARDIRDVHIYQPVARLPAPSQLPPPVRLAGRTEALAMMEDARAQGLIVITGPPGIGKTALAVSWGHVAHERFPDGTLFEDLHGHAPDGPASPSDALGRFLRALGVPPRLVPPELAELTAMYRSLVADKRLLVVLDDALTAAQVYPLLPPSAGSLALVTSRWRLTGLAARGARVIQLGKLDSAAALELLSRTLGDDRPLAEPHAARELVNLCARVPLALCVAGARLAARSRWPISEMVEALAHEQRRLAALAMEDDMSVRPALDLSYRSLGPAEARMYRTMALYPGTHFDSSLAAATASVSRPEAKRLLGVLTDANMLDDVKGGRYRFHDLTRLHARELAERCDSTAAREIAVRRMLDWFLITVRNASRAIAPYRQLPEEAISHPAAETVRFIDAGSALDWLDDALPDVLAAARLAADEGLLTVAWQLADAVWPLFVYRGRYTERLEFDRLGLSAAQRSGNMIGEAKMLNRLGLAVMTLDQFDDADECFHRALSLWEQLGNRGRIAGSMRRLGLVAAARGRPDEAIGWLGRALTVYRELDDARKIALTLSDLGDALISTGQASEAVRCLRNAGSLLADVRDPYSQVRVLTRLGRAHEEAGDVVAAGDHLLRALHAMRDIGSPRGEAEALTALGGLAERTGELDEARQRYADAERILVMLGHPQVSQIRAQLARLPKPGEACGPE